MITDVVRLAEILARHKVRWVLVGGLAVVMHGGSSSTLDMDLAVDRDDENLGRLADALEEAGAHPRRWRKEGYRLQAADLASGWLHLSSDLGPIDLLTRIPGAGFAELEADAERIPAGDAVIPVASIERLMAMKRLAGRPSDQEHLRQLEAILAEHSAEED